MNIALGMTSASKSSKKNSENRAASIRPKKAIQFGEKPVPPTKPKPDLSSLKVPENMGWPAKVVLIFIVPMGSLVVIAFEWKRIKQWTQRVFKKK